MIYDSLSPIGTSSNSEDRFALSKSLIDPAKILQELNQEPYTFIPRLPADIHVGDVLIGRDGNRLLVVELTPSETIIDSFDARVLSHNMNVPPSEIISDLSLQLTAGNIASVERNTLPHIFSGQFNRSKAQHKDCEFLRPGDQVIYDNGDRFEVMRIYSDVESHQVSVEGLIHKASGETEVYTASNPTFPGSKESRMISTILECRGERYSSSSQLTKTFEELPLKHPTSIQLEELRNALETEIVRRVVNCLSQHLANNLAKGLRPETPAQFGESEALVEGMFKGLKNIKEEIDALVKSVEQCVFKLEVLDTKRAENLIQYLGTIPKDLTPLENIESVVSKLNVKCALHSSPDIKESGECVGVSYSDLALSLSILNKEIEGILTNAESACCEQKREIKFGRIENLTEEDLQEISALSQKEFRNQNDSRVAKKGGVMQPFSAESLKGFLIETGSRIIIHSEVDISGTNRITGFLAYKEPGSNLSMKSAYARILATSEDAAKGTAWLLLNSCIADLQRTGAEYIFGRVMIGNSPSMKTEFMNGGLFELDNRVGTLSTPNGEAKYITIRVPVRSDIREQLWPLGQTFPQLNPNFWLNYQI